jgi:transcriptional regulator with XRE-family HTH domain
MSRSTISLIETGIIKEIGVRKLSQICARLGLVIETKQNKIPAFDEAQIANALEESFALAKASATINEAFQSYQTRE